jgi:exodeoxyribonuclease-3
MPIRIATWNVNSVRLRLPLVEKLVRDFAPDVICLQEIKCRDEDFPREAIAALGFPFIEVNGQAGYHGVATLSRRPMKRLESQRFCGSDDARHIAVSLGEGAPLIMHNVYIPAGGDIPDPELNPKFKQKLLYIDRVADWFSAPPKRHERMLLLGDFNVAPLENDVWSHKQLLTVVSHTPVEVEKLSRLQASLGWIDPVRRQIPPEEKLYTWWSYRARDWRASNRGRRLDHLWATPQLSADIGQIRIVEDARGWTQPSDHVPIIADLKQN